MTTTEQKGVREPQKVDARVEQFVREMMANLSEEALRSVNDGEPNKEARRVQEEMLERAPADVRDALVDITLKELIEETAEKADADGKFGRMIDPQTGEISYRPAGTRTRE